MAEPNIELRLKGSPRWLFLAFCGLVGCGIPLQAQQLSSGAILARDLGCSECHEGVPDYAQSSLRNRTPDLTAAGLRYEPGYLFEFLQNPVRVRRHLGAARMPGFHLSEKEALALVSYLQSQTNISRPWPELPAGLISSSPLPLTENLRTDFAGALEGDLICLNCHTYKGQGGTLGLELVNVGYRIRWDWMISYLVQPRIYGVPQEVMPAQFFQLHASQTRWTEMRPDAAKKILLITSVLYGDQSSKRREQDGKLQDARLRYPEISPEHGRRLFESLNCVSCHRHDSIPRAAMKQAPDLSREGARVQEAWLIDYLQKPHGIRPFGYHPGDGTRMPDFALKPDEASQLASFIMELSSGSNDLPLTNSVELSNLSEFSRHKSLAILQNKVSCLGCHQWNGDGGRIGPDLGLAKDRLRPEFVYQIIRDPQSVLSHRNMPKPRLPEQTAKLLSTFLSQSIATNVNRSYLSSLDHSPLMRPGGQVIPVKDGSPGRVNYLKHCAACHGEEGRADGFNRGFLKSIPTVHADSRYMSQRPDDTLYDGIAAGGYILNKSHLMPAWGNNFSSREIRELVSFLRQLCQCRGPDWSIDPVKER